MASPARPPHTGTELEGVATLSRTNAWAAGGIALNTGSRTLIAHWNGTRWTSVAAPSPGSRSSLIAISMTSARDGWAIGSTGQAILILHWNGTRWTRVAAPAVPGANLDSVSADRPDDAWAVGQAGSFDLVLHWNGRAWTRMADVPPGPDLVGVSAFSPTSAWAVGDEGGILAWDGTSWTSTFAPFNEGTPLDGVAAISASRAWAVGEVGGGALKPLILRITGN